MKAPMSPVAVTGIKTMEYRVVYAAEDYCGQWSERVLHCNALTAVSIAEDPRKNYPYGCCNSRIESREVSSGPWRPTMQFRGDDLPRLHSSPESPLISTLRYLIDQPMPKAELLDRLVRAVGDANTTVDGRALTAAEMRHEGEL